MAIVTKRENRGQGAWAEEVAEQKLGREGRRATAAHTAAA